MPYFPFDTGWVQFLYGCMFASYFIMSRKLCTPKYVFTLWYNCFYGPLMSLIFKSIGVFATAVSSLIICTESIIYNNINYINPIYNTLQMIGSILPSIQSPPVRSMDAPRAQTVAVAAITNPVVDTCADTLLGSEEHLNRLLSLQPTTTPPRFFPLIIPPSSKSQVQNRVLLRALPLIFPTSSDPCAMLLSMPHHMSSLTR
jgi:hypothetical protein